MIRVKENIDILSIELAFIAFVNTTVCKSLIQKPCCKLRFRTIYGNTKELDCPFIYWSRNLAISSPKGILYGSLLHGWSGHVMFKTSIQRSILGCSP